MASGEAEPLQYTTTALRVSIHCEGCKKKVKKVLHSIEGVYKVTVDAAQHKVTVTGNVEADALLRRLHKAGKQAALWPSPAPAEARKPEEAAPAALPAEAGESGAKDAKPPEAEGKEKKPAKDKKADKGEPAAKPNKEEATKDVDGIAEPKEKKGSPEPAKQEEPSKKQGKKNKKNKPKDGDEGEAPAPAPAPAPEKKPHEPPLAAPSPPGPPHGAAFPYYAAAQPVLSYNVAHPSSSVSYYAPTPGVPMHHLMPYPAAAMVPVPAEFLYYGPPGTRSSPPPREESSCNNLFNEDNANSCILM